MAGAPTTRDLGAIVTAEGERIAIGVDGNSVRITDASGSRWITPGAALKASIMLAQASTVASGLPQRAMN